MLVNMRELLADAMDGNYAVGSFSVANMEMVLGVLKAADELKAPVILQIAEVRLKQSPLEVIGPLMVAAAENASLKTTLSRKVTIPMGNIVSGLTVRSKCGLTQI